MIRDSLITYALEHGEDQRVVTLVDRSFSPCDREVARQTFEQLKAAAAAGSGFAMCVCSRLSAKGWGTDQSNEQAFHWANQAAASNYAPGSYELGICFEKGVGTGRSFDRAIDCYARAADLGFSFAAYRLGMSYYEGELGPRDAIRALHYIRRAAALGDLLASLEIAQWYESGEVVARDEAEAVHWYRSASERGNPLASHRLAVAQERGELGLPRDIELARQLYSLAEAQASADPRSGSGLGQGDPS